MKKIIVGVACAAMAFLASAATVDWGSGVMTGPNGEVDSSSINAYLFLLADSDAYDGYAADVGKVWTDYKDKLGTAIDHQVSDFGEVLLNSTASAGDNVYAAIIYTFTDSSSKEWYMANIGYVENVNKYGDGLSELGTTIFGENGSAPITWSAAAVPEPTSGLLLLLGMAGLALKRKRA